MITVSAIGTTAPRVRKPVSTDMAYQQNRKTQKTIRYATSPWSLGHVLVAARGNDVCAILFGDSAAALESDLAARFPDADRQLANEDFRPVLTSVLKFIEQPAKEPPFKIDPDGTGFQRRVWRALQGIEPGTTASYKDIAVRIGSEKAVRAVAKACAANPIAVAIPCHRVVRSDGALSGYRWGIARKRALLAREARQ